MLASYECSHIRMLTLLCVTTESEANFLITHKVNARRKTMQRLHWKYPTFNKKNRLGSAPLLPLANSGGESHVTHILFCPYWFQTYRHTHPWCSLLLAGYGRHLFWLLVTAILLFKSLLTAHDNSWASVRTGKSKPLPCSSLFTTTVRCTVDAAPNCLSLSCNTFLSIVNKPDRGQGTALAKSNTHWKLIRLCAECTDTAPTLVIQGLDSS